MGRRQAGWLHNSWTPIQEQCLANFRFAITIICGHFGE
jgi:hypothetical protein